VNEEKGISLFSRSWFFFIFSTFRFYVLCFLSNVGNWIDYIVPPIVPSLFFFHDRINSNYGTHCC